MSVHGRRACYGFFFSAAAYERDKARAIEAGADGYMTKPIDPHSLAERVNGLLKGRCLDPL